MTPERDPDDDPAEAEVPDEELVSDEEVGPVPRPTPSSEMPEYVPDDWLDQKPFDPAGR